MRTRNRFIPITRKVNFILLASLIVGTGTIILYFARDISRTIEDTTRSNLRKQSQILFTSIENFMLPGEAPLAVKFFEDLGNIAPGFSVNLFRVSGEPAFSDNKTLEMVNKNIGRPRFQPREPGAAAFTNTARPEGINASLQMPPRDAFFRITEGGRIYSVIYKPLVNLPKCTGCHGSDHTIRGLIDIQTDITDSVLRQRSILFVSVAFFLGVVLLMATVIGRFLHRTVINPVRSIGVVCSGVTTGNFTGRVDIPNNDEIGILGRTVNTMVEGLHERFMLSKFVSSSTLKNLRDENLTRKTRLTIFFSDIRGFTSYSETHTPEEVVEYLNKILTMQTDIIHDNGGDVDKYVGDEIVALWDGEEAAVNACRSARMIQHRLAEEGDAYNGLQVGIGITCGEVILGLIGSQKRADYTVIGDTVNTASRFCSAAKAGQIIISDEIFRNLPKEAAIEGPFKIKVKGKIDQQRVYILKKLPSEPIQ
jgi:class 3 adenylate cyclase